jgi:hypothetical protein
LHKLSQEAALEPCASFWPPFVDGAAAGLVAGTGKLESVTVLLSLQLQPNNSRGVDFLSLQQDIIQPTTVATNSTLGAEF